MTAASPVSQTLSGKTGAMRQADPRMSMLEGLSKSSCPSHLSDIFGPPRLKDLLKACWKKRPGVLLTIPVTFQTDQKSQKGPECKLEEASYLTGLELYMSSSPEMPRALAESSLQTGCISSINLPPNWFSGKSDSSDLPCSLPL